MSSPETIKRIVVRSTNWVGDAMMTIPALRELRRLLPAAHITLVTRPWAQELFAEGDFIDDLLIYDRRGLASVISQTREWRRRKFECALLFQNAFEAALIPALAGVPFRIGYATEHRSFLLTHSVALPDWRSLKHEVYYYLNLVAELEQVITGNKRSLDDYQVDPRLHLTPAHKTRGLDFLQQIGLNNHRPVVALCPGSINSRAKRWPTDRFASLGDLLIESGAEVLLIGSSAELEVTSDVMGRMRNKPIVLTGRTSLSELVDVLNTVDLLITNDTGPAHIAAALARPTLVIFGPTNPLTTRPFSTAAEVLREPPDCAPCMLRDCPIDHRCMTAISPTAVFAHAQKLLQKSPHNETRPTGAVA